MGTAKMLNKCVQSLILFVLFNNEVCEGQFQHFFGPPAIGFGVGVLSVHRRFPVATSIVSRRASRSYSHQYHHQATPFSSHGYSTSTYTENDHYYSSNNLRYYQPNVYHYHSTPWHYRWGRSADVEARQRREDRLIEVGDLNSIPLERISDVAANVSVAYKDDIWQNDMISRTRTTAPRGSSVNSTPKGPAGKLSATQRQSLQILLAQAMSWMLRNCHCLLTLPLFSGERLVATVVP